MSPSPASDSLCQPPGTLSKSQREELSDLLKQFEASPQHGSATKTRRAARESNLSRQDDPVARKIDFHQAIREDRQRKSPSVNILPPSIDPNPGCIQLEPSVGDLEEPPSRSLLSIGEAHQRHDSTTPQTPQQPRYKELPSFSMTSVDGTPCSSSYGESMDIDKTGSPKKSNWAKERTKTRKKILELTKLQRDGFLLAKKEFFLPLLPPSDNYIEVLAVTPRPNQTLERVYVHEPNMIDQKPKGVEAVLKPHQFEGLSFLVYLHKNGMSGILGDEMGLGKTLQTLAFFQFLEETERNPPNNAESSRIRPHLVICPLGVLNSWRSEAQRWTPQLKVLLFHGVKHERDRLKRVALGKEDWYGNQISTPSRRPSRTHVVLEPGKSDLKHHGDQGFHIILTSYETFESERSWFRTAFLWRYVVLDEGHRIKNPETKITKALHFANAEHRLILTGTPVQNNLYELWSLLHWLYPDVFTNKTSSLFTSAFDLSNGKADMDVMENARSLLELIMLRRTKYSPGMNLDLPPKEEILLFTPLTPFQRQWYERLITRIDQNLQEGIFGTKLAQDSGSMGRLALEGDAGAINTEENRSDLLVDRDTDCQDVTMGEPGEDGNTEPNKTNAWRRLMNLVMQLRKCCTHPFLIPGAMEGSDCSGRTLIEASGKFIVAEKLLRDLVLEKGKKVLIFSVFTEVLDGCEELLNTIGDNGRLFRFLRLDGATCRPRRSLNMRLFADNGSPFRVMLISTDAGGLGINLTAATEVIFMNEHWNPQVTLQAEARAHRIGQTQKVTVYKLCTQGTVEEQMLGRIRKKLYLSLKIVETMENKYAFSAQDDEPHAELESDVPNLGLTQLMSLIRHGTQTLSHQQVDVTEMLSWDIDTMISRCRDKPADSQFKTLLSSSDSDIADGHDDDHHDEEQKWLSQAERVECTIFDGKRLERRRDAPLEDATLPPHITRADRRVGKNVTVTVDGYAVSKQSLACSAWEAVPTSADKTTRFRSPPRSKRDDAFTNQGECLCCWDGGTLVLCGSCPRAYHTSCLDEASRARAAKSALPFRCPQHECFACDKKTAEAGGLLFRCRWCPRAFCEFCLDWEAGRLVEEALPELEALGYGARDAAYYVECATCCATQKEDEAWAEFIRGKQREFEGGCAGAGEAGGSAEQGGEGARAEDDTIRVVERDTPPAMVKDSSQSPTPRTPTVSTPTSGLQDLALRLAETPGKRKIAQSENYESEESARKRRGPASA